MFKPLTFTFQGVARRINTFETKRGETVQQLMVAGLGETLEVVIQNQAQLQACTPLMGKNIEITGEEERSDRFSNRYYFGSIKELK